VLYNSEITTKRIEIIDAVQYYAEQGIGLYITVGCPPVCLSVIDSNALSSTAAAAYAAGLLLGAPRAGDIDR